MPDATVRPVAMMIAAAIGSWVCVAAIRRYALSRAIVDHPTERSSHGVPTPRGGGAGAVVATMIAYLVAVPSYGLEWQAAVALFAVVPTAIVGWLDDRGSLGVLPRVAVHVASGLLLLPLAIGSGIPPLIALLLAIGWVVATVAAINVVNFIDGIDGLIGLQAAIFGLHLAWLGGVDSSGGLLGLALAAAVSGFLFWNWPPARIFLGDVGSGALAILGLVGALLVLRHSSWPFLAVFLPLFPIFLDAATTIIRRARARERLTVPHRSHLYQRIANGGNAGNAGWGHARVSLLYGAVSATGVVIVGLSPSSWLTIACAGYIAAVVIFGWSLDRSVRGWSVVD